MDADGHGYRHGGPEDDRRTEASARSPELATGFLPLAACSSLQPEDAMLPSVFICVHLWFHRRLRFSAASACPELVEGVSAANTANASLVAILDSEHGGG